MEQSKELRMLKYAIQNTFDPVQAKAAEAYVDKLQADVADAHEESKTLKDELKEAEKSIKALKAKLNATRSAWGRFARGRCLDANGSTIIPATVYYGEDGRGWQFVRPRDKEYGFFREVGIDPENIQPLRYEWLTPGKE